MNDQLIEDFVAANRLHLLKRDNDTDSSVVGIGAEGFPENTPPLLPGTQYVADLLIGQQRTKAISPKRD